jgi:predicted ribonuclease toxin of YeeF-YezG toxin-antitoxin module
MSTFDGIDPLAKKDIDELFKTYSSDAVEINFMELVEVYKHVVNAEIHKKEEKMGKKKSTVAPKPATQMTSVKSMAPRKPAESSKAPVPSFRGKR